MGSLKFNSEIVESREELRSVMPSEKFHSARTAERDWKPQVMKRLSNKYIEDDINQLFAGINIRKSASLDLSERGKRDASKRPMRGSGGPNSSPVIGFSDPVSIKQALRGLCISQAAEVAAMKRSSMVSGSPRFSYRSDDGSSSFASNKVLPHLQASTSRSLNPSAHSSPRYVLRAANIHRNNNSSNNKIVPAPLSENEISKIAEENPAQPPKNLQKAPPSQQDVSLPQPVKEPISQTIESIIMQEEEEEEEEEDQTTSIPSCKSSNGSVVLDECNSGPRKVTTSPSKPHKLRRRGIPLPNAGKSSKDIKTIARNRKLPKSKPNLEPEQQVLENSARSSVTVICQRCQCELKDVRDDSSKKLKDPLPIEVSTCSDKPDFEVNQVSKLRGEFSQSSKSSIGDYSCSTTVSEESNNSGSSFGTKRHMSNDTRWEAINLVRKNHGFLGLGHFSLLKKLGSGDIGTVYLAELVETNCLFAIKVMDNEFLARRKKMPRAQTEREILRMLDHPFLPTLYAQFTSDNLSCLAMEFCPGGDLHVLRQRQPGRYFPEPAARFYVAEVLLALEYLHMLGVVYRDLKPENIMVREDGHIMLTDFDLSLRCLVNPTLLKPLPSAPLDPARISGPCAGSKCIDPFCAGPSCKVSCFTPWNKPPTPRSSKLRVESSSFDRSLPQVVVEPTEARSNSFVGTHEYLAPEIIKGEGHGSAVDWWTLGVFLYELLYGKTPFKGAGVDQTLGNVVLQNLRFPESPIVSFQARDLIRGLLVKEPENRLGSKTGAAEIKRHPFFDGLNWALIRCTTPPQVPEFSIIEDPTFESHDESNKNVIENTSMDSRLEFRLF
ncbi:unnamed protein product [Cuscuta europaea]|uniref:non-specific serine/threonine protein kinase n=1 Tax=Cuscuta europaea TaxID=41803 RepID=A0A9P1DZ20_CUSEU|nr:unnamed protein product [Cuscuta europaea]